ncbi:MAG: hypothetical protein A3I68_00050 [Candidatus Melainabacteria bacterium RIFCSPLOWO2_02_FULL_35_15]|nr:MAG: hypothetical protein A3I68_00050 [Candidatus Melainabacteria bacterium RIFCSPLOWO2_02_FULL_35_15]
MIPIPAEIIKKTAFEFLKRSPGVVQRFSPQASNALDKLMTLFNPEMTKIASETASATLTAGNSAAVAAARQLRLDPKHIQDCLSGLYGHVSSEDWNQLNELFGLMKGHENALEILGDDGLKVINGYFSRLKKDPLAILDNVLGETGSALTQDPEKIVLDNLLGIIKAKVENPNGHIHNLQKALDFVGYKFNVTDYIADKVLTSDFENCLRACIKGEEPAPGLLKGFWQKQAFNHCRKLMNYLGENPDKILAKGPQAAYWMRYTSGPIMLFLNRIPIIGKLLCFAFPFATDIVGATGEEAVRKRLETIAAVIAKNKTSKQEVPPVASGSAPAG